jgi:molybdate transport system substrate-binding protein
MKSRSTAPRSAAVHAKLAATLVASALTLTACGTSSTPDTAGSGGAPGGSTQVASTLTGTVTVLAAASLTESFDQLKADFEKANPGVTIEVSYGSSATLVQQVNQGAPAQVIALAGEAAAEPLDKAKVKASSIFATNVLEIAVPPSNPGKVADINDLGKTGLKVVLCAATVPCGKAADSTFKTARIVPSVVSREIDVKATLAKVKLNEADAAVVYHSDVVAAKGVVTGVTIREPYNTKLRYPVITLSDDAATKAFVAYLTSAAGLSTVQSFGLGAP